MGTIDNRDVRVTIAVHDQLTQKSYQTRAFPGGRGPGLFSAPVSLDANGPSEIHWMHVTVTEEEAHVLAGNKIPAPTFQVEPVHQSHVRLSNGRGRTHYDVARRYRISISIELAEHDIPPQPNTSSARAMEKLLRSEPSGRGRIRSNAKVQSHKGVVWLRS